MIKNIVQAVILAGGKGTRLGPITYKIPKVMIDINGKPFLQYVLESLKNKGISKILLLVSYLGEQIEEYLGNGRRFGLDITYSYEDPPLGTGGALKKAEKLIAQEFLLLNGDTYLDFDYRSLKDEFDKLTSRNFKNVGATFMTPILSGRINPTPTVSERSESNLGCKGLICVYICKGKDFKPNILLGEDNRVIRYDKDNTRGLTGVDAGVGIFKKDVLKLIPGNKHVSFENQIYKKLMREKVLYGFPVENKFLDIGVFKRLDYAKRTIR